MKEKKNTSSIKKHILVEAIAMCLLAVVMLVGFTYAWFNVKPAKVEFFDLQTTKSLNVALSLFKFEKTTADLANGLDETNEDIKDILYDDFDYNDSDVFNITTPSRYNLISTNYDASKLLLSDRDLINMFYDRNLYYVPYTEDMRPDTILDSDLTNNPMTFRDLLENSESGFVNKEKIHEYLFPNSSAYFKIDIVNYGGSEVNIDLRLVNIIFNLFEETDISQINYDIFLNVPILKLSTLKTVVDENGNPVIEDGKEVTEIVEENIDPNIGSINITEKYKENQNSSVASEFNIELLSNQVLKPNQRISIYFNYYLDPLAVNLYVQSFTVNGIRVSLS